MGSKLGIAVVTRETRMQGLRRRYATTGMAAFALEQAQVHERARRNPQAVPQARPLPGQTRKQASPDKAEVHNESDAEVTIHAYQVEDDAYRGSLERLERDLDFGLPLKFV